MKSFYFQRVRDSRDYNAIINNIQFPEATEFQSHASGPADSIVPAGRTGR
jgi:hypothetical protein